MKEFGFICFSILFLRLVSFAQPEFKIDTIYFPGEKINKISYNRNDGSVWVLKGVNSRVVGKVDLSGSVSDISASFTSLTTKDFTDIICTDSNYVFFGTAGDWVFRYNMITKKAIQMGRSFGIMDSNITSLSENPYSLMNIGTFKGLHTSFHGGDENSYSKFYQFYEYGKVDVFEDSYNLYSMDYNTCGFETDMSATFYTESTAITAKTPYQVNADTLYYSTASLAKGPSYDYKTYFSGTNYGIKRRTFNCRINWYTTTFLPARSAYTLFKLKFLPERIFGSFPNEEIAYLLAGTDSGLYLNLEHNVPHGSWPEHKDTFALVEKTANFKIYDIDADPCYNTLWLATDKGLVKLTVDFSKLNFTPFSKYRLTLSGSLDSKCQGVKDSIGFVLSPDYGKISGFNYHWQRNGVSIPGANSSVYMADSVGNYTLKLSNKCYPGNDTLMHFNLKPGVVEADLSQADTVVSCEGQILKLSTMQNVKYTYQWIKDNQVINEKTNALDADRPGHYKVIVTNCSGSSKSDSVYFKITPFPNPGTVTGPAMICPSEQNVFYSTNPGSGLDFLSWNIPTGSTSVSQPDTNTIVVNFAYAAGQVCVTGKNKCGEKKSCIDVSLKPIPATPEMISGNIKVCNGKSYQYTIGEVKYATSYSWLIPSDASVISGQSDSSLKVKAGKNSGEFCVSAVNKCGSSSKRCLEIVAFKEKPAKPLILEGPSAVCIGRKGVEYTTPAMPDVDKYKWIYPPSLSGDINLSGSSITLHDIKVPVLLCLEAENVCGSSEILCNNIGVFPLPDIHAGHDTTIIEGSSVQLAATGGLSYQWSSESVLSCSICKSPVAMPLTNSLYIVTAVDSNGCIGSDSVNVIVDHSKIIFVPGAFSPDGNNNNDILFVRAMGIIKSINFTIYNRWGEKVFETASLDSGWDGSYKGEPMNNQVLVYYVQAEFIDGTKANVKGDVSLIRD